MDRWAAEIGGYSISITEEALENESMSLSEALVLAYLFSLKNGAQLSEMKKTVLHLNGHDYDEFDEAVEAMHNGGYVRYGDNKWMITDDGTELFKKVSTIKEIDR